ncbi:MAG: hypothetical protein IPP66_07800 [Anaerolineales bacterium]|nr:hypothetical protein [Anaerolineales bacterium]
MNMANEAKKWLLMLVFFALLSNCNTFSAPSQTATITPITISTLNITFPFPTPSLTPPPTSTPITSTPTHELKTIATSTDIFSPTLQNHRVLSLNMEFPKNLNLDEWALTQNYDLERIKEGYKSLYNYNIFPSPLIRGDYNKVMLNGHELTAKEEYQNSRSYISVVYNGHEISRVDAGKVHNTPSIWGLWTYQNQWIMEYISVFDNPYGGQYQLGNIVWDGESLNDKFGYQESFGLTAIDGGILYFFRRNNQVGISYDGVEYNLGYQSIVHYACCEAGYAKNPHAIGTGWGVNQNLSFFAERNGNEYFVVIWAQ